MDAETQKEINKVWQVVDDLVGVIEILQTQVGGCQAGNIKNSRKHEWPLGASAEEATCFSKDKAPILLNMPYEEAPVVWKMAVDKLSGAALAKWNDAMHLVQRVIRDRWDRIEKARRAAEKKEQAALDYKTKIAKLAGVPEGNGGQNR